MYQLCQQVCARARRLLGIQNKPPKRWTPESIPYPTFGELTLDIHQFTQIDAPPSTQPQSPLFNRLPLELRLRIYSFALPEDKRLWIRPAAHSSPSAAGIVPTPVQKSFGHFPCKIAPVDTTYTVLESNSPSNLQMIPQSDHFPYGCCLETYSGFYGHVATNRILPDETGLALMQSCRLM
jgi:hypothetical protein